MHTHLSWKKGIKLRKKKATVGLTVAGLRPHLAASCDGKVSIPPAVAHPLDVSSNSDEICIYPIDDEAQSRMSGT